MEPAAQHGDRSACSVPRRLSVDNRGDAPNFPLQRRDPAFDVGTAGSSVYGLAEVSKVVLRPPERFGDGGQGSRVPALLDAMLEIPQRRDGDAGPLGQFPLAGPCRCHLVGDGPSEFCRIGHRAPLSIVTVMPHDNHSALDSAINHADNNGINIAMRGDVR